MARPGSEKWVFPPVVGAADEAARRGDEAAAAGDDDESEVESDGEGVVRPRSKRRKRFLAIPSDSVL